MFIFTLIILIIHIILFLFSISKEKNGGIAVIATILDILFAIPYVYLLMIL